MKAGLGFLLLALAGSADAGVFIGATVPQFPATVIMHPQHFNANSPVPVLHQSVCFDASTLPAGVARASVTAALRKAVGTWNGRRAAPYNRSLGGYDLVSNAVDFESVALHELGHCIGLGHPTIADAGVSGTSANATSSRPDAGNSYDLNPGPDGIFGSADDLRGDNVNLYWFDTQTNDPLSLPALIDTQHFSSDPTRLPAGNAWPANANANVMAQRGFANTAAVMSWQITPGEVRRRLTGEDFATLRLAEAGYDGLAATADDYQVQLDYNDEVAFCDIPVSFSNSVTGATLGSCSASAGVYPNGHGVLTTPIGITLNPNVNWYFSTQPNVSIALTSAPPTTTAFNAPYAVTVVLAPVPAGAPVTVTGTVEVSDGSAVCSTTASGSLPTLAMCLLTSTTAGPKTVTATYLGQGPFDSNAVSFAHSVSKGTPGMGMTDTPDPVPLGGSFTVTATVGRLGPTHVSGGVTITSGTQSCRIATLDANGRGSCSLRADAAGELLPYYAAYDGDSNYNPTTFSRHHDVLRGATQIAILTDPAPSAPGADVTAQVRVTGVLPAPTGTVAVQSGGQSCNAPLSDAGNATAQGQCVLHFDELGAHTIAAHYAGDDNYTGADGDTVHTVAILDRLFANGFEIPPPP